MATQRDLHRVSVATSMAVSIATFMAVSIAISMAVTIDTSSPSPCMHSMAFSIVTFHRNKEGRDKIIEEIGEIKSIRARRLK